MADSSCVQRAELLADLGRYDEAAAELAEAAQDDAAAHTLLARVKLASGKPREALRAADAAVSVAPADLSALIARGMVLADLGRVDEAAAQAEQILAEGVGNGYAHTSAAAILAEVRIGQLALDAAWEGVRLTPDQPRAHLVLGVIAAGLGLRDVAARAYQEALALDPRLPLAQTELGVARLEQLRYAQALSHLTDTQHPGGSAPQGAPAEEVDPDQPPPPPAAGDPDRRSGGGPGRSRVPRGLPAPPPRRPAGRTESRTAGPRADQDRALQRLTLSTGYALLASLWVVWAHTVGIGAVPTAVLLAIGGVLPVAVTLRWLPRLRAHLPARARVRIAHHAVVASVVATPLLLLGYAVVGAMWPLAVAVVAGAAGLASGLALRRG